MIVLTDVGKKYGEMTVLEGVSLRINPGEFACIIGPSGAGKSTLLSLLVGAAEATEGTVSVDDVDLRSIPAGALQLFRRRVGIVFQDYKLLQNRTVAENIAFPLEVCGVQDAEIARRVRELLQRMNLTERASALPRELSGGEKARTAIARAIVHKPMILLVDEPTGNLDPAQATMVVTLLREINAEGATVVVATHDAAFVQTLGARVIELDHGRVVRDSAGAQRAQQKKAANHAMFDTPLPEEHDEHETIAESDDGDAVTVTEKKSKKKQGAGSKKKKIRITSIHSE